MDVSLARSLDGRHRQGRDREQTQHWVLWDNRILAALDLDMLIRRALLIASTALLVLSALTSAVPLTIADQPSIDTHDTRNQAAVSGLIAVMFCWGKT